MYIPSWLDKVLSDPVAIATLVLALVTAVLAVASFRTIRQNYKFREKDRKERLLNEIIEWAINVAESGIEPDTPDLSVDKDAGKSWPYLDSQFKKLKTLQLLRARSVYMESIALAIHKSLHTFVKGSIDNLRNQLRALYDYKKFMDEHNSKGSEEKIAFLTSTSNLVDKNNKLLYKSAVGVIEEAAKIKTESIGKKRENMSKESEVSKELTLNDIKEHLKQQDKRSEKGKYLAMGSTGAAVTLVGLSLLGQGLSFLGQQFDGWALIVLGFGFMYWCAWKQSKVK